MKHFYRFLFIAFVINSWRCAKFEEGHEKVCLRPFIEFVSYVIDSTKSIVTIKAAKITNGTLKSAIWNFNDGTSKINHNRDSFTHAFPPSIIRKSYNIELEAFNFECPESSKWYDQVSIPPCLAMPNFDAQISNNKVKFVNTSNLNNQKATYLWNFGNGNTSTSFDPTEVAYSTSGRKTVSLRIQTACGAKDTIREIFIPCTNKINCPNSSCIIVTKLQWNVFTFSLNNGISVAEWSFNDNTPLDRKASTTHSFENPGSYNVIVKLTNECEVQFYSKMVVVEKPKEEYDSLNINGLSQNNNYHQITYYKDNILVLLSDRRVFIGGINTTFIQAGSSEFNVDLSNKLKKDNLGNSVFNISKSGVRKFVLSSLTWNKPVDQIFLANDIDCHSESQHFTTADEASSILFVFKTNRYYQLFPFEKRINIFNPNQTINENINLQQIDNESLGLIFDPKYDKIYFNNKNGIIQLNINAKYDRLFEKSLFTGNEQPIKTLISKNGNLYSLSKPGSLYFINVETLTSTKIWQNGIRDFDIIDNGKVEPDVIIAGNNLLKYLKRN